MPHETHDWVRSEVAIFEQVIRVERRWYFQIAHHSGGINTKTTKSKRPLGFEVSPRGCFQQRAAFKRRYCVSAAGSSMLAGD
jgi:hypothetical protein